MLFDDFPYLVHIRLSFSFFFYLFYYVLMPPASKLYTMACAEWIALNRMT
jgi:hypothetical protein